MAYKGVVKATQGVLLGGVKEHQSSWFDTREDAESWLETVIEINNTAGRTNHTSEVKEK